MAEQIQNKDIQELKKAIETLVLIELCKRKATRPQIRDIMGGISNNTISKVNVAINGRNKNGQV
jgi:uncharacterized protein YerC